MYYHISGFCIRDVGNSGASSGYSGHFFQSVYFPSLHDHVPHNEPGTEFVGLMLDLGFLFENFESWICC